MRYFDITRLAKRAEALGPSGIDRVDLAYHQWLSESGSVNYLLSGMSRFSEIDKHLGQTFLDKLISIWKGDTERFNHSDLRPFRDTPQRLRMMGKWRARRSGLATLQMTKSLHDLCGNSREELDLLDVSAEVDCYQIDPRWRGDDKAGYFFGISHAILTRTAYLAALSKHKNLKRIFFIHDTIPCDYPEFCRENEGRRHLLRLRNTFRYASHVVVNSEYTKQRLEYWRLQLGEPEVPVKVIPIGVDEGLRASAYGNISPVVPKRPYFVILGTIEPRKNHALLLHLWRHFEETLPEEEIPELLIIGRRGWENEFVFRMLDRCESLHDHVRELNGVNDSELWPLLRTARAMLFPSFVEGWGMPLVEALTLGVPVIGSDIDAFREAGKGVPELISPLNGSEWAEKIINYAQPNSVGRMEQLIRLEKYSPPTWKEHFQMVEEMLADA